MNIKQIIKVLITILLIIFMTLYLTTASNHQEIENKKQYILTEESIKQFEQDLEQGKEIVASNYLKKEKNYNNKISKYALKLSNLIESTYKKGINKLFKKLSNLVEE